MHRSQHLTWISALVVLGVPSLGCRNTNSDGTISVQPQYSSLAERLKGPQARLGTSGRSAADRLDDDSSPEDSPADGSKFSLSDQADSNAANSDDVAAAFSTEEMQVLEEAFANATPEIRELAMRRIAAQRAQEKSETPQSNNAPESPSRNTTPEQTAEKPPASESAIQQTSAVSPASKNEPTASAAPTEVSDSDTNDATEAIASAAKKTDPSQFQMPDLTESSSTAPSASAPQTTETATVSAKSTATESPQIAATVPSENDSATANNVTANSATVAPEVNAAPTTPTASPQVDATAVATHTPSIESLTDAQLIEELIARHSKRAEENTDQSLPELIRMRTLQILANRPDDAMAEIEGWSAAEREYLNQQMLTLWHLTDPSGHPVRSRRWTTALPSMREATKSLAASTGTLEVRSMQFCQEVLGFGQTVPFESREYFAGQKVILYYEVDNFDAERLTDGYETHLRGSYQILDTNGQLVAEQILQDDLQTCSNFRRDYFIAYVLHLPKRLAPGSYRFELTVEDVKGHTYGQASVPLDVKAL